MFDKTKIVPGPTRTSVDNMRNAFSGKTGYDLTHRNNSNNSSGGGGTVGGTVAGARRTGGGGSSKKTTISGSTSGNFSGINAADLYNAQRAAQQSAANEAYNNTIGRIGAAYDAIRGNIQGNYDSSVDRLNESRKRSMNAINADAEDSLRQAYINNELTKKDLNQRLSAMGYNGGATESTMASLGNQYGNARNNIDTTRNGSLADLEETYQNNLAAALQSYNDAMSNLEMQKMQLENSAETARANALTQQPGLESLLTMDNNYLAALQNALANQGNFSFSATEATNDYTPGNAQQANAAADTTNYSKLLQQYKLALDQGANPESVVNNMYQQVYNGNMNTQTLAQMFKELGINL